MKIKYLEVFISIVLAILTVISIIKHNNLAMLTSYIGLVCTSINTYEKR